MQKTAVTKRADKIVAKVYGWAHRSLGCLWPVLTYKLETDHYMSTI